MRVSLQWLQELVACDLPVSELAERLSIAGFEVEGIEDLGALAAGVVVGFVEERQPHPNADKLSLCRVRVGPAQADGGAEPLQIVCGASNVRAGIHVPVALVGAHLPAVGLTIQPAELRGVASSGMICSLRELGLTDAVDGIAILDDLLDPLPPLGSPVGPALGLDDQVLELAITANRPDGLSMRGIAREVAALTGAALTLPASAPVITAEPLPVPPPVQAAFEAGGLFSITAMAGVRVEPSPGWLQRRLERAGLRPINNVVDITNLVMLETGQPLHAFDLDRLEAVAGGQVEPAALGLRPGRSDERFEALDGSDHRLGPDALVVTLADRPVGLAGVIGGAETAVQPDTTRLWLEAAAFAPEAVRRSARSVGLRTEASARFEKGLPPEATLAAADRAAALLAELAGARLEGRWLHQRATTPRAPLPLRRDAVHNLLGPVLIDGEACDLADERIESTLTALGCDLVPSPEGWNVSVPPARAGDLQREVDLIEEVARLVGYDAFACHLPDPIEPGGLEPGQQAERRLRWALCQAGLQEICSFSLVPAINALIPDAAARAPLANPLLTDYGHLRDTLAEELLQAARRNRQASQPGFWAFEIGTVFQADPEAPRERKELAGVICGDRRAALWESGGKPRPPGYFESRGILQRALVSLSIPCDDRPLSDHPLLHPGRAAELVLEGRAVGWFGQLHPAHAEALDLPESTHLFELSLEPLLIAATRRNRWQPAFAPFATVPAAERDLSLEVPRAVTAAQLLGTIRKAGRPLLESVDLIDRYEGSQVADGCASQAFRLRFRDVRRTLTDAEVEQAHGAIRAALERQCGARLRA